MKICVDVWVTRYKTGERVKVTSGVFTYVALGQDGKPTPVAGGG
jgi:acyl-CoA thioesterase YciA